MNSKQKIKGQKVNEAEAEEWDLSQGMGILPDDILLTQNIGCVGGKKKNEITSPLILGKYP